MARQRIITRTITFQETEIMCLDIETAQAHVSTFTTASPTPLTLDQLTPRYDTDNVKPVATLNNRTTEQVYGRSEDDFMAHAHVITR